MWGVWGERELILPHPPTPPTPLDFSLVRNPGILCPYCCIWAVVPS
nr:hypothetical protein [Nostoc sp. ChiSLP01]